MAKNSEARAVWALLFLKSTNAVGDTVSCNHFAPLILQNQRGPNPIVSWEDVTSKHLERVAAIYRQTSKWCKNAYAVCKIADEIVTRAPAARPKTTEDWLAFHEIGPKTAALLQWSLEGTADVIPIDVHVWKAFRVWNWTNALTTNESTWQARQWFPVEHNITINDAIGSIRQTFKANPPRRQKILRKYANTQYAEMLELLI